MVGLVLEIVEPLATLGDLVNVVLHCLDGAIDFLYSPSAADFQAAPLTMRLRSQEARGTYTLETLCARIAGIALVGATLDIGVVETAVVVSARHCCSGRQETGGGLRKWA